MLAFPLFLSLMSLSGHEIWVKVGGQACMFENHLRAKKPIKNPLLPGVVELKYSSSMYSLTARYQQHWARH